ncbi:MAG: DUF4011 domain-containing protein [Actinomycetia bacterium]|nr:DUF4011 domain-containing protein [Actinomycetes bacterium]
MTFSRLLSESIAGTTLPTTGDVLAVGLPFLRQLDRLHQEGLVLRSLTTEEGVGLAALDYDGHSLRFDPDLVQRPSDNHAAINSINPSERTSGIEVAARLKVDHGVGWYQAVTSGDVFDVETGSPDRPAYLVGYRAWEQLFDHHDVLTDIALAGLVLTSYATGLDLDLPPAVHQLALQHKHLVELNPGLHPVVAGVLSDMIRPDRHERPSDLGLVLARLEHHRDLPADLDLTGAYSTDANRTEGGWRLAVLSTLRERVFDLSRRNRQLYFKNSSTALSLTEASVPLMLNVERIQPSDLLTWTGSSAEAFRKGKPVDLAKWCRFEEAPHIAPSLEKLISGERKFRAEHGQGRLQLIIAFLRWVDPETGETINSPLLSMPAQLAKKKGVQNRYTVEVNGTEAEISPSLRFLLRTRFAISLPPRVETDAESIRVLVEQLTAGIQATDPSVEVDLVEKPRINLIKRRAQLRVDAYRRRRAQAHASSGRWRRQDHSYDIDDWRPLGLALYRRFVESTELPLRSLTNAPPFLHRPRQFAAPAPTGLREQERYAVMSGDVSRQRWEVDLCAVTLASLGSRRTTLARDYDALIADASATGPEARPTSPDAPFNLLFSPEPLLPPPAPVASISIDQPLVLPADDAQARAVRRGVRGDSFIIQGPPGTGKSQTIANLIAALVADDKRVLFVCEKRAALDVVAHRLDQVGLDEIVATIHDSQLDRKAFIKELGSTYERWLATTDDDRQARRDRALADVEAQLRPIQLAFEEIHRSGGNEARDSSGRSRASLVKLIERLVLLRAAGVRASLQELPTGLDTGDWLDGRSRLDAVAAELTAVGLSPCLGSHGAFRLNPASFGSVDPLAVVRSTNESATSALLAIESAAGPSVAPAGIPIRSLRTLVANRDSLLVLKRLGLVDLLDQSSAVHSELRTADDHLRRWTAWADHTARAFAGWRQPIAPDDARNALALATEKEGSTFKFLDGGWRKVKRLVESAYDLSRHQVEPSITQVLTDLVTAIDTAAGLEAQRGYVRSRFGTDDPSQLLILADRLNDETLVRQLVAHSVDLATLIDAAGVLIGHCDRFLIDTDIATVADVQSAVAGLAQVGVIHERALVQWVHLADASLPVLNAAVSEDSLDEIERSIVEAELESISARLSGMTSAQLEGALDGLLASYRSLLTANADLVASRVQHRFLQHVAFSEASMAGRSDEDKAFKKSYNAGRRVLEQEFQKKIRHRSIRDLASGDTGLVLGDLKPVWLMSPLSVSDTLPLDDDLFDVVIFDEASQIPVEDAVPTLHRGKQAVVVGDRMQLPPTRFFSAEADDEDDIMIDDDGHRLAITLDADSFLTQADISLESALLSWHYRSRHESLIAYSNHAFYDARLATVPDRQFTSGGREPLAATTSEDARENLDRALERPISFHKIENGLYRDRRNELEADYIAQLVRSLLQRQSQPGAERLTIGIVAFSEAQQTAIEDALAEAAMLDSSFATLFEEEQLRVDDDEFVGLFVKNLENVQGDERDIIIMSVCYGPGPNGKMKMNFGPINQAGGERRLNVIFSRSRRHMAIVSSIEGHQITNTHNDGANNLARFLDYAAAESEGDHELSASLLSGLRQGLPEDSSQDGATRSAVAVEVAAQLRQRGWEVDLDVGRSLFTVDAAIRGETGYLLGVLIDPGEGETAARMVAEAGVLEAFGWPIARILITEWWSDPNTVADRLDLQLRQGPRPHQQG